MNITNDQAQCNIPQNSEWDVAERIHSLGSLPTIASCKIVWEAAHILSSSSLHKKTWRLFEDGYEAFISGRIGQLRFKIADHPFKQGNQFACVDETVAFLEEFVTPDAAALHLLLCAYAAKLPTGQERFVLNAREIVKRLGFQDSTTIARLRRAILAMAHASVLKVKVEKWKAQGDLAEVNFNHFESVWKTKVRLLPQGLENEPLEAILLERLDWDKVEKIEFLIQPGTWAGYFLAKADGVRREIARMPIDYPKAVVSSKRANDLTPFALCDFIFRERLAKGKRKISGMELLKQVTGTNDLGLEKITQSAQERVKAANKFERFLKVISEFYSVKCLSRKFMAASIVCFSDDGYVTQNSDKDNRAYGFFVIYLDARFEFEVRPPIE